jgi:formate hydrogenlyase transcriptional activator
VIERSLILCETEIFSVDENWLTTEFIESQTVNGSLGRNLTNKEKARIEAALAETRGRVSGPSGAAEKLGLPASTLESKIRSLRINKHAFKTI